MGRGMVKPRKSITMRATVPYCTNVVTRSNRVSGFRDPTWCRVTRPFPPSRGHDARVPCHGRPAGRSAATATLPRRVGGAPRAIARPTGDMDPRQRLWSYRKSRIESYGTRVAIGSVAASTSTFKRPAAPRFAQGAPPSLSISLRKVFHFPSRISMHPSDPPTCPTFVFAPS